MKQRSSATGGSRRTPTTTDGRSLEAALVASSLLLWLPYSLAAIYVAYCRAVITEVPLGLGGPLAFHTSVNNTGVGGFAVATATASGAGASSSSASSAGGSAHASAVAMGAVESATAMARQLHHHSALYTYVFPADFDLVVFLPLLLRVVAFSALAVAVTVYLAVYHYNAGEYLMVVAWALGTCSDYGWLTSATGVVQPARAAGGSTTALLVSATPSPWLWLVVSLLTGLFSGILCKVKDIVDGKHDRDTHLFRIFDRVPGTHGRGRSTTASSPPLNRQRGTGESGNHTSSGSGGGASGGSLEEEGRQVSAATRRRQRTAHALNNHHLVSLGDRLYMVVPFCTGQWFSFILHHGWRGIIVENGTILLSLSLVGYTMLSFKFLKRQVLRASGRVSRSVAARGRTRRNERRLREQQQHQQQQQQYQGTPSKPSSEDYSAVSTPAAEGSGADAMSRGATAAGGTLVSDEDAEEEMTDFFEDVGEVAFIDVIDLISKLFTTSFGVVVLGVVGLNIFMTSLCIPFLKALFKLNALVSGVGIVIELIMYEVA